MIEAATLTFGYRRGLPIIGDWSASIEAGEVVALTGPSGSGKSTLLYLLGTLVRPWSGTLRLSGVDVSGLGDSDRSAMRARLLGFVFQDALLDQRRSVLENVVEGAVYGGSDMREARQRARSLLEQMDVDVELGRRASDLSGGQAQRIGLCRALLNRPRMILADEPTGNLDEANAVRVESVLFEQAASGAAVIIATHSKRLAARCGRTFEL